MHLACHTVLKRRQKCHRTFIYAKFTVSLTNLFQTHAILESMASFDESVKMSSDERFEFECTPCKDDDVTREAKHFCPECSEYYCDSCEIWHRRLKATRSHKVLHGDEMSQNTSSHKQVMLPFMYCTCNKTRLVEFICEEHLTAACLECKGVYHRKCKTASVQEKGKSFSKSNITATYDSMKAIAEKIDHLQEQQAESIESFAEMKNACKEQIEAMRQKLHAFVDKITDASLGELDTSTMTHSNDNDDIITTTASTKAKLQDEMKRLENAIATADRCQMLVADTIAKQRCNDFHCITADIEKDFISIEVTFDDDETLTALIDKTTKLGNIRVNTKRSTVSVPKDLASMSVIEDKDASFSPKDAKRITGSAFMPNGDLLICDRDSKTVSLFDQNFNVVSTCHLSEKPWNVAPVTDIAALVSLYNAKKLQFIETKPLIKKKTCIALDKSCFGIAVAGQEIFVSVSNNPGKGEIRILDVFGNFKRRLGANQDDEPTLDLPTYILLGRNKVFVSEYLTGELICLRKDRNTAHRLFEYSVDGSSLSGMINDELENVYICDEERNCCYAITDGGTKHATFLELPDKNAQPTSISFRAIDSTLIVTGYKKIYVYKVKPM